MGLPASKERLRALVSSFAGRRLLVAGDYVLDRFVFGHPKRISREAPVLILRFWKEESLPGAAGNTAANVRALVQCAGSSVAFECVGSREMVALGLLARHLFLRVVDVAKESTLDHTQLGSGRVAESGLRHSTRNRAWGNPPWVRIPPLPLPSRGRLRRPVA